MAKRKTASTPATFATHFNGLRAAMRREADGCSGCGGKGYIWRQFGPDDIDKDVCEACLDLHLVLAKGDAS
jgi:hypothetical protein